jgi:hypothetical protein
MGRARKDSHPSKIPWLIPNTEQFGIWLKSVRPALISAAALGRVIGCSRYTIWRIENNKNKRVTLDQAALIWSAIRAVETGRLDLAPETVRSRFERGSLTSMVRMLKGTNL